MILYASLLDVPNVDNFVSEFLNVLSYFIYFLFRGHIFENDLEVFFLLRFIVMEFSVPNFEFLHYIGIFNGVFWLYFELFWVDIS